MKDLTVSKKAGRNKLPHFTIEQHREASKKLNRIQQELIELRDVVSGSYSKANTISMQAGKLVKWSGEMICTLDSAVFEEYPDKSDQILCNIYYGRGAKV